MGMSMIHSIKLDTNIYGLMQPRFLLDACSTLAVTAQDIVFHNKISLSQASIESAAVATENGALYTIVGERPHIGFYVQLSTTYTSPKQGS